MKISFKIIKGIVTLLATFVLSNAISQQTSKCLLTSGVPSSEVSTALPAVSIKTGLDFNLAISVPGLQSCGNYTIKIETSNNIQQGSGTTSYPFGVTGINTYQNSTIIPTTAGLNFGVPFKFKPGVTCNGEIGDFKITITTGCGPVKKECVLKVSINAIAINTWSVKKEHIWGNLSGGSILWRITLSNSDPSGFGTYNIASGGITDNISSGTITSVNGTSPAANIFGSTATWGVGTIANTTSQVQYDVYTTSCDNSGTIIKNCADFLFTLGKSDCSAFLMETKCDTVTLSKTATANTNFVKYLTYGNSLNYAQGCEGEYTIQISNAGNIPLTSLQLSDAIPVGITVTSISISSTGANMTFTTSSPTGSGNTASTQNYTGLSLTNPSTFLFNTNSGVLLGETITIKMRFTITASQGTSINNCAKLTYNGTYNGWASICNTPLPPLPGSSNVQRCASFVVQASKAIPGLKKCIPSGIQSYDIGDDITFKIVVSNHGQGNLSGYALSDMLNTPQFLEINGPIMYSWGNGDFTPNTTNCVTLPIGTNLPSTNLPSWLSASNVAIGSQSPSWSINGMPGNCNLDKAYYLVIEFKAKVRPGAWGNYSNTAKLVGTTNLTSSTPYNINRIGKLDIDKYVNSGSGSAFGTVGYVNPGQAFAFKLVITNSGSVALQNIDINDALPACVTQTGNPTATIYRADGTTTTVSVSAAPALTFSPAVTLAPGDSISVTINVTRNANDNSPECCNNGATVTGAAVDNLMNVFSISGKACVKSSLCCDIQNMNVTLNTYLNGNGINPVFFISSGAIPIQQIDISLVDYHVVYDNENCKPANIGNYVGHIQPFVGNDNNGNYYNFNTIPFTGSPTILQQTAINPTNNSLTWSGTTPINLNSTGSWNFNGLVVLNFVAPNIVNLDCCSGKVNFCFKVSIKDVACNVCEKILCSSEEIPKKKQLIWKDEKEKAKNQLSELKNSKSGGGESLMEFIKRLNK
jgi:uncharacterized repeat protein (TIGR01451 family)